MSNRYQIAQNIAATINALECGVIATQRGFSVELRYEDCVYTFRCFTFTNASVELDQFFLHYAH